MSIYILSKCTIELTGEIKPAVTSAIDEFLKTGDVYVINSFDGYYYFEMGGNKDVDYSKLESLIEFLKKNHDDFTVTAVEYVESDIAISVECVKGEVQ